LTNKNLLITGANGCVGQYLIDWFLKNSNYTIFLMVRNPNTLSNAIKTNKRIKLLICDLRESKKFNEEINNINYLVHTATAWGNPKRAYEVNVKAFKELLNMLRKDNLERIIYFSTASILDKNTELMKEAMIYGTEYIQTKYLCYESLIKSKFSEITDVIFPTLVFGGTLDNKSYFPISYLTAGLQEAKKWLWLARFFKLESKFHFIHAKDIAQICGYLIGETYKGKRRGFKKFVLGQKFITIDQALVTLLKKNNLRRFFSIKLTKGIIKILLKLLPIQTTNWDSFSIKKYDFNHKPITSPETFGLTSYAKTLNKVIEVSKLPRCNIH
tara:strand:- start:101 stop:1084 length:984 start_codon:yes stop_codon:yes gene_type:complete